MVEAAGELGGSVVDRQAGRGGHATVYLGAHSGASGSAGCARAEPYWLAMQFVDGGKFSRPQSQPNRLAALAQIADALDYAHRHGIVHADVEPANILVADDFSRFEAYLIDFEVARAVVDDIFRRPKDLQAAWAPSAATDRRHRRRRRLRDHYEHL
ncbi:lipopolysaccharide kinase InaA family protein [Mycobacterium sp.]|uniref:protein kinase domain-containing protein n=1 Tax=Mycobacterium sp. TaxID=1785 RepID=UPI001280D4B0|nr:lipopolysaccharide kinase InaA family protein [Mycobacterium sp.]KAA8961435.1 MAG: protein kinase [Mycobacterium sp.]